MVQVYAIFALDARSQPITDPGCAFYGRHMTIGSEDQLRQALRDGAAEARGVLEDLVRIPSISAAPEHAVDVDAVVEHVADLARQAGAADVGMVRSHGGQPAVIASWPAPPDAPTVLLYAHADVQPTGPLQEWTSAPFEPTERDGRLYGRGAADDKAGVAMHLAVLRAFAGRPPVGVVLFIEGEEEIGSPTLPALLREHRDALGCDVIVIADSGNASTDVPAITTSLRGLVDVVVDVRMLERPVHSGVYGGPVGDALTALCRLLATLHDDDGDVAIDGLHTATTTSSGVPEDVWRAEAGVLPDVQLMGTGSIPDRTWMRPAVSVLAIDAPPTDQAINVLIPRARAAVSLRLAPGQDAQAAMKALVAHLETNAPWGAQVEVTQGAIGEPFALETIGPAFDVARGAFADAYASDVVEMGIGGSIPFIAEFARAYPGAAVLVTGVGDPASRWHGIDESLHLDMWQKACLAEALLLQRLAGPLD
jgi:acetylornithine deacetylase/succinyl-diaminopimelate desuccinylase-like protein